MCFHCPGLHLEGPFISKEKKGAHNEQYIRTFPNGYQDVVDMYGNLDNVAMVTLAPELERSSEVIQELCKRGIKVSLGNPAKGRSNMIFRYVSLENLGCNGKFSAFLEVPCKCF